MSEVIVIGIALLVVPCRGEVVYPIFRLPPVLPRKPALPLALVAGNGHSWVALAA
jgi:hypothetical protein